ncbi:hypothetical protein BDF21DRAFT_395795 [Thamnidium elegans]|nr:hypothetical protein BDF21DRAFT_395795 [Thamnidium elegans]
MTDIKNENATHQRGPSPADYMNLMNKIPNYSGSRDVNKAEIWLKTVKSYKGFFTTNFNHEMFLTAITNSFTDRAEDWWDTVVQVTNNSIQEGNHLSSIDINAVKRKGTGSIEEGRTTTRRKGKEKENVNLSNMEIDHPEGSNSIRPNSQFVNYTPHNVMSLNEPSMNTLTEGVIKPTKERSSCQRTGYLGKTKEYPSNYVCSRVLSLK